MHLIKKISIVITLFCCFFLQNCQPSDTPSYAFFVAGHTYGSPVNAPSKYGLHPPFIAQFEQLNQQKKLKFGVLTGDVARHADPESWPAVWKDLEGLNAKIHIAAGNHDVINRQLFEQYFPESYYAFQENKDLFIILDPNLDHWNITGEQLIFLRKQLEEAAKYRHIFVFFHQLLWWQEGTDWGNCQPNSFQSKSDTLNFHSTILPLFKKLDNQVFLFAGDVGAVPQSSAICYLKKENISFIASGMGVDEKDNFLIIEIDGNGEINMELIGLKCQDSVNCLGNFEDYLKEM